MAAEETIYIAGVRIMRGISLASRLAITALVFLAGACASLAGTDIGSVSGHKTVASGEFVRARINHVFHDPQLGSGGPGIIAHGVPRYITFFVVPGSGGREVRIKLYPSVHCPAESEEFDRGFERLAIGYPSLRVRYHPDRDRFAAANLDEVIRARRQRQAAALALLDACPFEPEQLEDARSRLLRPSAEWDDVNSDEWLRILIPLFLAIDATRALTDWGPRRVEGACSHIVGRRLLALREFRGSTHCSASVSEPIKSGHPSTLGIFGVAMKDDPADEAVTVLSVSLDRVGESSAAD